MYTPSTPANTPKTITVAAQRCRKEELMPNGRFSKIKWRGTINPMTGPAAYQGQGWLIHSMRVVMRQKQLFVSCGFGTAVTQSWQRARIASSPQATRARHESVAPTGHERQHPSPGTFGEGCQRADSLVAQVHMAFAVHNDHPFQWRSDEHLRQNSLGFVALQGDTSHPRHVAAQPFHRLLAQMAWAVVV